MSVPIEHRDFATPEPYALAPTPPSLTFKEYEALALERSATEEKYDEAVNRHDEWKAVKKREEKEAQVEKLKKEKEARLLKVETLRKEKLEAERRAEEERKEQEQKAKEKRLEDEWVRLEAKKEQELALEREKQEAVEHQHLADLKEKEEKEKEKEKKKEDEANEVALQVAGALLASDRDSEVDLADPKMATMDELKRRRRITKGKKKVEGPGAWKRKIRSVSLVEESEDEAGGASAGPSTPKCLKTEPAPQANDKVFSGNGT